MVWLGTLRRGCAEPFLEGMELSAIVQMRKLWPTLALYSICVLLDAE